MNAEQDFFAYGILFISTCFEIWTPVLANNISQAVSASGKLDSEVQSGSEVSKMLSRPQL